MGGLIKTPPSYDDALPCVTTDILNVLEYNPSNVTEDVDGTIGMVIAVRVVEEV